MLCLQHALAVHVVRASPSFCARTYSNLKFEFRGVLIGATEAIPCFPILVCGNKLWISCRGDNERSAIVEELFSSAFFLSNRENNIQFFHLDYISAIPHTLSSTQIRDDARSCVLFMMITQHFVVVVIACEMELWRRGLEGEKRLSRVGGAIKDISRRLWRIRAERNYLCWNECAEIIWTHSFRSLPWETHFPLFWDLDDLNLNSNNLSLLRGEVWGDEVEWFIDWKI